MYVRLSFRALRCSFVIGGKCGTSGDSPSGAKGALCDAWRAKHGSMAKFSGYGPPVLRVG